VGDYGSPAKYSWDEPNGPFFCAQNRVNAQFGLENGGGYVFDVAGGTEVLQYDQYGNLFNTCSNQDYAYSSNDCIAYYWGAQNVNFGGCFGATACCPTSDQSFQQCDMERVTSGPVADWRDVIIGLSDGGNPSNPLLADDVSFDLYGPDNGASSYSYTLSYIGDDLNTITSYGPNGQIGSWDYQYWAGASSPDFVNNMTAITNPNGDTEQIQYSNGMVQKMSDFSGVNWTKYAYTVQDCAVPGSTDCVQTGSGYQQTTINYPDGETDVDQFTDGQLTSAKFGGGSLGTSETWTMEYIEPWATEPAGLNGDSGQNGPIEEIVSLPDLSQATIYTDSIGNVEVYTDPMGNTTSTLYNDVGGANLPERCWSVPKAISGVGTCSSPPAGAASSTYDSSGFLQTSTDARGNTTSYGYYANGLLCWESPPSVSTANSHSQCLFAPPQSSYVPPAGDAPVGATTYSYDGYQHEQNVTTDTGGTSQAVTTYAYNLAGQLQSKQQPNGGVTDYYYNNPMTSLPSETIGPLETVTQDTYDVMGDVLTSSVLGGATTYSAYDANNRQCWSDSQNNPGTNAPCSPAPAGSTVYNSYLANTTAPTAVTDPDGNQTKYQYGDGRFPADPTVVTEPPVKGTSIVLYNEYSMLGQTCVTGVVTIPAAQACTYVPGDTMSQFDSDGRLQIHEDQSGNTTSYKYGQSNVPTEPTQITRGSEITSYSYNEDGSVRLIERPDGSYLSMGYNANNLPCYQAPIDTTAGCSNTPTGMGVTKVLYSPLMQTSQETDNYGTSSAAVSKFAYDGDGNLVSETNDNGMSTSYSYNQVDEMTCMAYPFASGSSFASSNCSNPASTTNHVVQYFYSQAGQMSWLKDWLGQTVQFSNYNALNELGTVTYPSSVGESVNYSYDSAGNVTSESYSGPIVLVGQTKETWTPNPDNQIGASVGLNNASSPTDKYNSQDELASATNPSTPSGPDTYKYVLNGEIQSDNPPGSLTQSISFSYAQNATDELQYMNNPNAKADTSYAYTPNGSRCLAITGSAQVANATCSTAPPAGDTANGYQWNSYGELCWSGAVTSGGTPANCTSPPANATTYTYDGSGLRMTETAPNSTPLQFDWDTAGKTPLMLYDGTNSYIYGPTLFGGTAPIEMISPSQGAYYVASAPSGVQAVFRPGGTAPTQQMAYSAWGQPTVQAQQAGSVTVPFGFDGTYTDPSGLDYMIYRYYDPNTDQFISVDPDVSQTNQPYEFAGDDPLNLTDPTGLCDLLSCILLGIGIVVAVAGVLTGNEELDAIEGGAVLGELAGAGLTANLVALEEDCAVSQDAFKCSMDALGTVLGVPSALRDMNGVNLPYWVTMVGDLGSLAVSIAQAGGAVAPYVDTDPIFEYILEGVQAFAQNPNSAAAFQDLSQAMITCDGMPGYAQPLPGGGMSVQVADLWFENMAEGCLAVDWNLRP
jgi:RHS repeat-associated protein